MIRKKSFSLIALLNNHIFMYLVTLTQKFLFKPLSSTLFLTAFIFPVDFTHLLPHLISLTYKLVPIDFSMLIGLSNFSLTLYSW